MKKKEVKSSMPASKNNWITIIGAREHNLKNINVAIPKNTLTVITGPSGSGKSSLALDVLYTEGKRRYMESLSSYARQFLGIAKKPDFDRIDGLCPAIAIDQKTVGHNPRSTVGTITEIYDYLRVLFARIGRLFCPSCHVPIHAESPESISKLILEQFHGQTILIAAPLVHQKKGEFKNELLDLFKKGYFRFIIDGQRHRFTNQEDIQALKLAKTYKHSISLLLDTMEVSETEYSRLQENIEKAFSLANGVCALIAGETEHLFSSHRMCLHCSKTFPEIEPRFFSFNSPIGACQQCNGLGTIQEWKVNFFNDYDENSYAESPTHEKTCPQCFGQRLNEFSLAVKIGNKNIYEIGELSIQDALAFFQNLSLADHEKTIAETLLHEIVARFYFLNDVGLSYLSLNRTARTLSGGEGQRIRLATQIGSALSGVLYVLDEPSIGLHQRDNDRLIATLKKLRDQGNTVVVVEHDIDTMQEADYLIDMGPAAGILGGQVTAVGTPHEITENTQSLSGSYLSGKRIIALPKRRRTAKQHLTLHHAQKNNLKDVTVRFPLEVLCCVSGVSGSGKSTLVLDELVTALQKNLGGWRAKKSIIKDNDLEGVEHLEALVVIDQSPIGRTPRSNPATYLGIFDEIRKLFAQLPESKARGFKVGRFSFNVAEGRCFECRGEGSVTVSMQFLADVVVTCKSCKGNRYNKETLAVNYKQKNIADVLAMSAHEAVEFFAAHKNIAKRLQLLCDVGLDYVALGQPSTTLSGGEAQRIKLVDELAKRGNKTLYILDEPTTGLHTSDIEKLLMVLNRLIDKGNSMIVIEHNIDVLKTADHIIDMGPEGGSSGGSIVAQGRPEDIARAKASHTGRYLKKVLNASFNS